MALLIPLTDQCKDNVIRDIMVRIVEIALPLEPAFNFGEPQFCFKTGW